MLIRRKHILPVLTAGFVFPAAALAAGGNGAAAPSIGLGPARVATIAPLQGPIHRFHHTLHIFAHRIETEERAAAAKHRRETFAHLPGGVTIATLESIAACESGGDPTAVSSDGTYRGKYQFDLGTWESVGGHGDPAAAPEVEQDYRAALLYSRSGSSPWPVCG